MEHRILRFWQDSNAFQKLRKKNEGKKKFSFLDGPITANNPMGVHHAWGRTYKDIFQRYKAMQGHELRYQNGFDCQGLWVEVEVEKELGFNSKKDIEEYGIAEFVQRCKERVDKYSKKQTAQSMRLGYWMDWENSYYTMSDENNYTIWLFLKRCFERGWIYKGHDVMPWCHRCGTALSEHEIATEGYREMVHPSVILRFPLKGRKKESLLVWTTTPWTLTSNVAAAVHPLLIYACVRQGEEIFYLAKNTLHQLAGGYEAVRELLGEELVGLSYRGPYDELEVQKGVAHPVIPWHEVSEVEGTGIVHIAPGCGKEDFALGKKFNLAVIAPLDESGNYTGRFDWLEGKNAGEVAEEIFQDLENKGILYKREDYSHRYPVCWRCGSELIFRLVDEWFISMDTLRHQIMEVAKKIRWMPSFGLDHELDWLRNMHDWCISKKRFWGLALPIYECSCGHFEVIGSEVELKERAVEGWERFEGQSPHRPWVDAVKIQCSSCGSKASRIPDVGNPWLDAGIVPYSTLGYRKDPKYWEEWFPPEFITECFPGQFRNWFYSLLAMSTVLENREPFQTVLGHALVRDEKGEEMHKSRGNAIWFDEAAEKMGVEVMRWIFSRQNPFVNLNFGFHAGEEAKRKLLTLWNSYSFFATYARLDRVNPTEGVVPPVRRPDLDRWLISKVQLLVKRSTEFYEQYSVMNVVKLAEEFLDDLSNWYIRRSRRRFWKSENDADKVSAYQTLYETLETLIRILAPILPFLTEEIYQNLVRSVDPRAPESVHLCDFPIPREDVIDVALTEDMDRVIRLVSIGRSARNKAQIKVRQPLEDFFAFIPSQREREGVKRLQHQILEELNVKKITFLEESSALVRYRVKPNFKVLGSRFGKDVPRIQRALEEMEAQEVAEKVKRGEELRIESAGKAFTLSPEDMVVEAITQEGVTAMEEAGYVVGLKTVLNPALIDEGFAREFIHKIQNMRKEAGFEVSDRIHIYYRVSRRLKKAIEAFSDHIKNETLSIRLAEGEQEGEFSSSGTINGEEASLSLERVKKTATELS